MTTNNGSYSYAYVPYTYASTTASTWDALWDALKQNKFYSYTTTAGDCSGFIAKPIKFVYEGNPLHNIDLTPNCGSWRAEDLLDGYATWRRAADDACAEGNSLEVSDELRDFIDELGGE